MPKLSEYVFIVCKRYWYFGYLYTTSVCIVVCFVIFCLTIANRICFADVLVIYLSCPYYGNGSAVDAKCIAEFDALSQPCSENVATIHGPSSNKECRVWKQASLRYIGRAQKAIKKYNNSLKVDLLSKRLTNCSWRGKQTRSYECNYADIF